MSSELPPGYEFPSYFNCDQVDERCRVEYTLFGDYFNRGACLGMVAAFGSLLFAQAYLGWRLKSWAFVFLLALATCLECMGYAARSAMSWNPWDFTAFMVQNSCLILAPTVLAAAVSITFKHIVLYYGNQGKWSPVRPNLYPHVFVGSDGVSMCIQAVGGALAAATTSNEDQTLTNIGSNIMVAGLVFQVVNMVFCGGLVLIYVWRRRKSLVHQGEGTAAYEFHAAPTGYDTSSAQERRQAKLFVWVIITAYIAIVVRCVYRIPEMSMGWGSELQKNETLFLILDGGMILLATVSLTIFHPAIYFSSMGTPSGRERIQSADGLTHAPSSDVPLCDEHRPSCHRCNRRGDICSFSRNPEPSESPPSMQDESDPSMEYLAGINALYQQWHARPSINETWGQGLELMHHYTEHVGNSLSYRRDVQHVWRVIVPEIAFDNPFLMQIILATSASHKAHLIPAQKERYLGLAVHHQTAGLEGFRVALCNIDSHDWKAIFCFSAMIGLSMYNTASTTPYIIDDDATGHVPLSLTGFIFIRGMRAVMKLLQPRLMESILSPLGNGVWVSNDEIIRASK
ncbi:hypothetical protein FSARC_12286 [Fusarium sarcochroum]|uniref:Uncharacterized protein n=1 Tax=Fusarium sarcochroum TaxID=1208366 RepID=A0A8H4WXT3_9HYPO|nr:hypothetical protein FSARC_12286 [Fusarium sarcochroum]